MSKIDSSYNFLFHPLHKDDTRSHDHTKRAFTLIASVAAGVFSLSLAHIIVYALHRHQAKKLPAETRIPSPSQSLSTSSSSENLKLEKSKSKPEKHQPKPRAASQSNSTILADAQLAQEPQQKFDQANGQQPEQSFAEDNPDAIIAQELQAKEDEVLSIRLARQLQELENPPVAPPLEDEDFDPDILNQVAPIDEMDTLHLQWAAEPSKEENDLFNKLISIQAEGDPELILEKGLEICKASDTLEDFNMGLEQVAAAANAGSGMAQLSLAQVFDEGRPVKKYLSIARHYFSLAAKNNIPAAQAEYGYYLENGIKGPKDLKEAEKWYRRAAHQQDPTGQYLLGCFLAKNDKKEAIQHFMASADQNYPDALLNLGICFFKGQFVQQDYNKSEEYLLRATAFKSGLSHYYLGQIYENIEGKIDIEKAIEHYAAAFQLSRYEEAEERLNALYEANNPVENAEEAPAAPEILPEKDPSEDVEGTALYTETPLSIPVTDNEITQIIKMADRGNATAQLIVGNYFEYYSNPPDLEKAKSYFEKAAKGNNLKALYRLALLLELRVPGNKDYVKAREYLQMAAAQGYAPAETELGDLDVQGLGRKKRSFKEARKHYEEATKQMEPFALIALADLCKKGLGGDYEPDRARMLYEIALGSRLPGAIYGLAECYELGIGGEKDLKKALKLYESLPEKPANVEDKIQKLKAELAP